MLIRRVVVVAAVLLGLHSIALAADEFDFTGDWAFTVPSGGAGWLGIEKHDEKLTGSMMWEAGSAELLASIKQEGARLDIVRKSGEKLVARYGGASKIGLMQTTPKQAGPVIAFRQPAMPPAPDLSAVKFDEPITLFNGHDLTGWRLTDPQADHGWKVKNGLLVNDQSEQGKNYGNLRTDREFEDFNLKLETKLAKGGNSGVFIRGIYEVQVADTYGRKLDAHNMGAIYSRITPTESAEKPAGQWQTLDITFVQRHATVVLNGVKIIDNQPVRGCTGGALFSDVTKPGPIYLQGDHTSVEYRNIVIQPVK